MINDICKMNKIYLLLNDNISGNFICYDGVHLNKKGTYILVSNLLTFINSIFDFN